MKLTVKIGDRIRKHTLPENMERVFVEGACPKCDVDPFTVAGRNKHIANNDTYVSTAHCLACKQPVGKLTLRVSTIFGLEEDERVIYGRARVY